MKEYLKLTKEELAKELKDRGIEIEGSLNKNQLIDILAENDEKMIQKYKSIKNKREKESSKGVPNAIGKVGAILNIIISSLIVFYFSFYLFCFLILTILSSFSAFHFFSSIFCFLIILLYVFLIKVNINFFKGKDNKVLASVLSLLFCFIIGGILILISKPEE